MALFFQTMPSALQEAVQLGGYIFPDILKLTTSILLEQSFQTLREHAVVAFNKLSDENSHIRRIMSTIITDYVSSQHNLLAQSHRSRSSAEQTIVTHSDPAAKVNDWLLVIKKDGKSYPTNPTNGYIS